jgi:hypothetical protein
MNAYLLVFYRKHRYEQQKKKKIQQKRSVGKLLQFFFSAAVVDNKSNALNIDACFCLFPAAKRMGLKELKMGYKSCQLYFCLKSINYFSLCYA